MNGGGAYEGGMHSHTRAWQGSRTLVVNMDIVIGTWIAAVDRHGSPQIITDHTSHAVYMQSTDLQRYHSHANVPKSSPAFRV